MIESEIVLPLYVFPNLHWFRTLIMAKSNSVVLEFNETWQKQTERTRYNIAGANGLQKLVIPTVKSSRLMLKEVRICYAEFWPNMHWRSLESAYNRSPFFEFYADGLKQIFEKKHNLLVDFNLTTIKWCCNKLEVDAQFKMSENYHGTQSLQTQSNKLLPYSQVFVNKHGFIPNLSLLDALFNLGPNASSLLL